MSLTSGNINFFCLYKPLSSRNNQLNDPCFLVNFLDLCNTLSCSSIILGDVDVHFDIPTNPMVLKINSLLNRYSLYHAITVSTQYSRYCCV